MSVATLPARQEHTAATSRFPKIIGQSPALRNVFEQIERAAEADATVLIQGESGTGKELVAEAIHQASHRRAGPLITVNMTAVPDTLIESELFGHEAGAFTGAGASRKGRFEAAQGGTIFIDEIGDLKLASQAKLLRVLENHNLSPVGSNDQRQIDVRVIAATNRKLEEMVAQGEFREDLYYRLNVVTISVPPLRQRRSDIPLLVEHYVDRICQANDKPRVALAEDLLQHLQDLAWPGNIRQLRNCLESMVVLSSHKVLTMHDLPDLVRRNEPLSSEPKVKVPEEFTLEDVEQAVVTERLDACGGNRTQAARSLGISVRTLQRRLKQWRINPRGARPAQPR